MQETQIVPRDISWLSFNYRVLQEAADPNVPLYERIKFLAIYSSNLDEFFRVRVASLRSFRQLRKKTRKELDIKPKKELKEIRLIVREQQEKFGQIFRDEILPALADQGICITPPGQFTSEQGKFARRYFTSKIVPQLETITIHTNDTSPPFLANKTLYLIVTYPQSDTLTVINIPSDSLPRFVELPSSKEGEYPISFLDDIIRFNLREYLQQPIDEAYAVKISRDAEIYIEDEFSGDLLEKIRTGLEERQEGLPTRFLYDSRMPVELSKRLKDLFDLHKNDMIPGARYHNFNDFFSFPNPTGRPELHYPPLPPLPHPQLEGAESIMEMMLEKDRMLHFPYQKFDYVPQLIREATHDPAVTEIKITLYRVAGDSAVVQGLLAALKAGKKVVAFIEAKARFDEASNLRWGGELEKAGATVRYSYPGIKVHTKLMIITREQGDDKQYFTYLGTGNFNEKTATLYCDHALLTADQRLGRDVAQVFDLLEGKILITKSKHLLVAPFQLRDKLVKYIDKEIAAAKAGKPAYMILKMNSLEESGMIEKLLEADDAGVDIKMIVRGICSLVPGTDSNIEIISIVDRFLEHARVYVFGNQGEERIYTASADWMSRNLHRRIEVAIPIYDEDIRQELRHIIDLQWADHTKARLIDTEKMNHFRTYDPAAHQGRAQVDIYRYLEQQITDSIVPAATEDGSSAA